VNDWQDLGVRLKFPGCWLLSRLRGRSLGFQVSVATVILHVCIWAYCCSKEAKRRQRPCPLGCLKVWLICSYPWMKVESFKDSGFWIFHWRAVPLEDCSQAVAAGWHTQSSPFFWHRKSCFESVCIHWSVAHLLRVLSWFLLLFPLYYVLSCDENPQKTGGDPVLLRTEIRVNTSQTKTTLMRAPKVQFDRSGHELETYVFAFYVSSSISSMQNNDCCQSRIITFTKSKPCSVLFFYSFSLSRHRIDCGGLRLQELACR